MKTITPREFLAAARMKKEDKPATKAEKQAAKKTSRRWQRYNLQLERLQRLVSQDQANPA
jgi:hypothetical protein